jgi:hypothetical protein
MISATMMMPNAAADTGKKRRRQTPWKPLPRGEAAAAGGGAVVIVVAILSRKGGGLVRFLW